MVDQTIREGVGVDDMELLHRYVADGDRDSISSLIRKYQRMVFSVCLRRLGCAADAEDAAQQVFMAMVRSAGAINSSVSQWLYRCAINVSGSMIRAQKSRVRREREKGRQTKAYCGNGEAERKETFAILMHCLGKLDATDQKVLVDNQVRGVTQQALAMSMGVTQQAVAKRIGKVILRLRREMTSKGVIFSLIAGVGLAARRAASAAIPEGLRAALTSGPSAALAAGGAAGAGTAGALKVGAAAVLVMAAVATYERAKEQRCEATALPAATVSVASPERPAAGGSATVPGSFRGNLPSAAPIFLAGGLPGQAVQHQGRQAPGPGAPSGPGTPDPPASRRQFDVASNRWDQQEPLVGPQSDPDQLASFLSSSAFWGTSFGRRSDPLAAKGEKAANPGTDKSGTINHSPLDGTADELANLAGGDAPDGAVPADTTSTENDARRLGRRRLSIENRQIPPASITERNVTRAWSDVVADDAVPARIMARPASSQRQLVGMRRWSVITVDDPVAHRPSMDDPDVLAESLVDAGEPAVVPERWTASPTVIEPASISSLTSLSKAITVADGALLAAAGRIDGRLINQGTVLAEGDDTPLYLAALVSGRGSYTGNVVFAGGFSPGNSPAAVHLDYAALDQGNVLTMELSGRTPGTQYDQLIIDHHLTLGGSLDVKLIYGFMPTLGDNFALFDGAFSGKFSDMTLPTLNNGLRWDASDLYTGGSLQVAPEPTTLILLAIGAAALLPRRHRA